MRRPTFRFRVKFFCVTVFEAFDEGSKESCHAQFASYCLHENVDFAGLADAYTRQERNPNMGGVPMRHLMLTVSINR